MKKLSDYKDEEALDLLAELIEPATEILADVAVRDAFNKDGKAKAVSVAVKNHKQSVMEILALLDGVPVKEYHCNVLSLPVTLLQILNDPELMSLFTFAGQKTDATASGSLTETTEGAEQ